MFFDEETENEIDGLAEEFLEAVRDERLLFFEGCVVVTAPTGAPPEYITVRVDGINDPNVEWRGEPGGLTVGDVVLVWHNPVSDRREIISGSGATATKPFVHDHHDDTEGGPDVNPETFSPQTFVVGPAPCSYTTLSAAVAAVNAFGPTAANPATIRVQGIYTAAEVGNVTIPEHCYLEGVGDGSVIDLGANLVSFSSDTGALDIVFTSSRIGAGGIVGMVGGATNVELRNVKSIATNGGRCFSVTESDIRLFDCIAEATLANSRGFFIAGTADDVDLEGCTADTTNFAFAFYATNTGTVVTKYCTFKGTVDVKVDAGTTWEHIDCRFDPDNCIAQIAAGTHFALPTKRFNQELIVAEHGGDFQALSEAITWINNQGDAASDKLYGVLMLTGNFAEVVNVTIPSYVNVFGKGEGTEIEMGANLLRLASHSSLQNVVVEASGADVVGTNNATNVVIRDVRAVRTGAAPVFHFQGSSEVECYHCIAESGTAASSGFYLRNTSSVLLQDCIADDTTNFVAALAIDDTAACAVLGGRFRGNADDVWQAAGATFSQVGAEISPANVTLPGAIAFLLRLCDAVGCALTHSAAQAVGSGAWAAITFDTERWDDHQAMGGVGFHVPANPTRITIPAGFGGRYIITGNFIFETNPAGNDRIGNIRLNGATLLAPQSAPVAALFPSINVSTVYQLNDGDFVELMAFQDTGAPLNVIAAGNQSPEFRVERK